MSGARRTGVAVLVVLAVIAPVAAAGPSNPRGVEITAESGREFSGVVGAFQHSGKEDSNRDYTGTINWGDGTPSTPATFVPPPGPEDATGEVQVRGTHTWSAPGSYTVTITVKDPDIAQPTTITSTARVSAPPGPGGGPPGNQPPQASFTPQAQQTPTGQKMSLVASQTGDPDGRIVLYEWDLNGDGSFDVKSGWPNAAVSFGEPGSYGVKLRVTDDKGATSVTETGLQASPGALEKQEQKIKKKKGIPARFVSPTVGFAPSSPGPGGGGGTVPAEELPAPECATLVAVGIAEVIPGIPGGCFKPKPSGLGSQFPLYTTRDLKINGIHITGGGGNDLTINPILSKLTSQGPGSILSVDGSSLGFGTVRIAKQKVNLQLPRKQGGNRVQVASGFEPFGGDKLGPFPINGAANTYIVDGGKSEIDLYPKLPAPFDFGTGELTATTSNESGLSIENLRIEFDSANLGALPLKNLLFEYRAEENAWRGGAIVQLWYGGPELSAFPTAERPLDGFGLSDSGFTAGAELIFPPPGIPLDILSISKLNRINFSISSNKPFLVQGGARVSALGEVGGLSLVSIDGCFMYVSAKPGDLIQACDQNRQTQYNEKFLRLTGQMKLLTIPWSNAYFQTDGSYGDFGSTFVDFSCCDVPSIGFIPLYSSKGGLNGKFNLLGYWQVAADQEICVFEYFCAGGGVLASDNGIIVCATYGVTASVGWRWGGVPDLYWGCEGAPYGSKLPMFAAGSNGSRAFEIEAGQKTTSIRVQGEGGVPRVALVGPNGERLETPTGDTRFAQSGGLTVYTVPQTGRAYFGIQDPPPGRWTLQRLDGSPGILGVETSEQMAKPRVRARVSGRGARRTLSYTIENASAKDVTIVEEGPDGAAPLARPKRAKGKLTFTPGNLGRGVRKLTAQVKVGEFDHTYPAGTYHPPADILPSRPAKVRIKRRGRTLVVSWGKSALARSYAVTVDVGDGRELTFNTRRRSVTVRRLGLGKRTTASIRGVLRSGEEGRAGRGRLRR